MVCALLTVSSPMLAAERAMTPECPRPTGLLRTANDFASVWQFPRKANVANRYYACVRGKSKPILLGKERSGRHFALFALAKHYVAYTNQSCGRDGLTCFGTTVVRNLRANTVRSAEIPDAQGGTLRLVLSPRGAIAWLGVVDALTSRVELRVRDSAGERVLSSGIARSEIDVDSLAISRSRLYWFQNDQSQTSEVGPY
jgi:hypothetical protein